MTLQTQIVLSKLGNEATEYFTRIYGEYLRTGKDQQFKNSGLRDLWFYIKIANLCDEITYQRPFAKQAMMLLKQELAINANKFINERYPIKYGNLGTTESD